LSSNLTNALFEDRAGNLWVGTSKGLSLFRNGEFIAHAAQAELANSRVRAICEDVQGNLWVGTTKGLYSLRDGRLTLYGVRDGLAHEHVRALYEDRAGTIWIGTEGGLSQFKDGVLRSDNRFAGKSVRAVMQDRAGCIWLGGDYGLSRFKQDKLATLPSDAGLSSGGVFSMLEDAEGSIWVGTNSGGVRQFKDGKFMTYTVTEGLSNDLVRAMYEDANGDIWFGNDKGLDKFRGGRFVANYTTRDGLSNDRVQSIAKDRAGDLWVGTINGLTRLRGNEFTVYGMSDGLSNANVIALYTDDDGNLWIGTDAGLNRFDTQKIVAYEGFQELAAVSVYALRGNLRTGLWIGTSKGLFYLKDDKLISYTARDGLTNNVVMSLYEDEGGALWIGTYGGGLSRFKDGKFTSVTTRDGLFSAVVYSILDDGRGELWMSGNRGIFRVAKSELDGFADGKLARVNSVSYGTADGMKSFECNGGFQPAAMKTRDNRLWFPTIKGAVAIDPARLPRNLYPPPVYIGDIVADEKTIPALGAMRLAAGTRRVEFHYTALSFQAPEKVRFRFKLEGYDKDWVEASARRTAYYTNLAPGAYRFRVLASNNDGVWNQVGAARSFEIETHFYQTTWFYLLCLLAVSVAIWLAYRMRVRDINERFALVLQERTRIARAMHDTVVQDVVGISTQLEAVSSVLEQSPDKARSYLDQARHQVRTSLDDARRAVWNLRQPSYGEDGTLAANLRHTAEQLTEGKPLKLSVTTTGTPRRLSAQVEDNLLRIGQELLTNAVRHAAAHTLRVELIYEARIVRLIVADDGCGFDIDAKMNNNRDHFGLLGINERAANINGQFVVQSAPGEGTKVVVSVPVIETKNL
jgi:signal transduction histidine kinase/streptogramin lyase